MHQRQKGGKRRIIATASGQQILANDGKSCRPVFNVTVGHIVEKPAEGI